MLINLTNHPSSRWSDKQKAAAEVYGEIVDMPFPVIDEAGDEKYIATLADEYLNKIVNLSDTQSVVVHLMGEQTFSYALIKRLRERGITCVASTTKRIVKEEVQGKKSEVIFQFERFRAYE
ncbi:MAG: CRISPR-associated protein [Bacteroidales bacterium]|nr:CRISPR-associated protein [Bacteroidales bacterium]